MYASETCGDPTDQLIASVFARRCPSRSVLEHVGSKWGILALLALGEGAYRFNALRRRVEGVSEKMLAQTLQLLERDGLITREVLADIPPKVEYSLTPLGIEASTRLRGLAELLEGSVTAMTDSQQAYDARGRPPRIHLPG